MNRWQALTIAAGLLGPATLSAKGVDPVVGCASEVGAIRHIHASGRAVAGALEEGLRRSATLRFLHDRVGSLGGYVYLNGGACRRAAQGVVLSAGMSHDVRVAGGVRVIVITVMAGRGDNTIASIAHELRHAIEVLESDAADAASVERLYERIGLEVHAGVFETRAARDAQRQVHGELARCKADSLVAAVMK